MSFWYIICLFFVFFFIEFIFALNLEFLNVAGLKNFANKGGILRQLFLRHRKFANNLVGYACNQILWNSNILYNFNVEYHMNTKLSDN